VLAYNTSCGQQPCQNDQPLSSSGLRNPIQHLEFSCRANGLRELCQQ